MARGKKCRQCNHYMFAKKEVDQPEGSWVYYKCLSCKFEEKVFEKKR